MRRLSWFAALLLCGGGCASSTENDDLAQPMQDAMDADSVPEDRALDDGAGDDEGPPLVDGAADAGDEPREIGALEAETGGDELDSGDVVVEDAAVDGGAPTQPACPVPTTDAGWAGACGMFAEARDVLVPDGWRAARIAGPSEGISFPNGLVVAGGAFGDRLLVSNAGNSSVLAIDRSTGSVVTLVRSGDWLPQPVQLTSIAWDEDSVLDGAAYVGSLDARRIFRIDPSGGVSVFAELTRFNAAPPIALAIPRAGPFRPGVYVGGEGSPGSIFTYLAVVQSATTALTTGAVPRVRSATGLAFDRSQPTGGNLLVMERGLDVLEALPNGASRVLVPARPGSFHGIPIASAPRGPMGPGLYTVQNLNPLMLARLSATGTTTPVALLGCSPTNIYPPGNLLAFSPDGAAAYFADKTGSQILCLERTCPRVCPPPRAPEIVSIGSAGSLRPQSGAVDGRASLTADGRYVAFVSSAPDLVPGDSNNTSDAFVYDRLTGQTTRASYYPDGSENRNPVDAVAISSDGRSVVFHVYEDLLLRDLSAATTTLLTVDPAGRPFPVIDRFSISADSATVAFSTRAALDPRDANARNDLYVLHRPSGRITLVPQAAGGPSADLYSDSPKLSADGQRLAFWSSASNLVVDDTNGRPDLFVADLRSLDVSRVSLDSQGREVHGDWGDFDIAPDGRKVVFTTTVSLSPDDLPGTCSTLTCNPGLCNMDVYLRDLDTGSTELISVNSAGQRLEVASQGGALSFDGRYVAFISAGNNHGYDDSTGGDVFVRDRVARRTTRLSVDAQGLGLLGEPRFASITPDGTAIAFDTTGDLTHAGTDQTRQIFVVPNFECP